MATAIMRKAFDNHDKDSTNSPAHYTPSLDKFALKTIHRLFHDQEMSGPLIVGYQLGLPDYYS